MVCVADAAAPVFAPAGFDDWHASAALITGFVAKEVVVGSMSQSYHADGADDTASQQAGERTFGQKLRASFEQSSHGHGKAAAIAFLLFSSRTRRVWRRWRNCDGNTARKWPRNRCA